MKSRAYEPPRTRALGGTSKLPPVAGSRDESRLAFARRLIFLRVGLIPMRILLPTQAMTVVVVAPA